MDKPRRRWGQFSLRTLLLLTIAVAGWLGWNLHQVRTRRETLRALHSEGVLVDYFELSMPSTAPQWYWDQRALWPSKVRMLMGDRPVYYICLGDVHCSWERREWIAKLFPEASVVPYEREAFEEIQRHLASRMSAK